MSDGTHGVGGYSETELRAGVSWVADSKGGDDKNVFEWLWEAIQGDFNNDRSAGQIAFDAAVSMIPIVDQVCDVRDLIANCRSIGQSKAGEDNTWKYVALALTLIGLFPELGSLVKGVLKIFFVFVRRYGLDHLVRATDEAMTWVITFLRKRDVQRYLPTKNIDEVFGWLAKQIKLLRGQVTLGSLLAAFDKAIGILKGLLGKVDWLPGSVGRRARETIKLVENVRSKANSGLGSALKPVNAILDRIIHRLEMERLVSRHGIVDLSNVHFRGNLPEARAVTLMRNAKPPPDWLSPGKTLTWREADPRAYLSKIVPDAIKKGHPKIDASTIKKFHNLRPDEIVGPAKLYRITGPSNGAAGDFWISEEMFNQLQKSPDPKAAWRKYLAVWPDWNPNGQFVVYDIPRGESLKVWRGKTASQIKPDLNNHLEGGYEQILMAPRFDTTRYYMRGSNSGKTLQPPGLSRDEWSKLSGSKQQAFTPIRESINDSRIKGPFDTGWGMTDFDAQLRDAKIGLPALPGQVTRKL